ncbi:MAG TPA: hypothetical protein VHT27_11090 [Solirubrobacteraceae bacterium]|nr:hypothetical protein [Solirubrobacteraceae bacterium]
MLLTGALLLLAMGGASAQAAESPSIEKFFAANCSTGHEGCGHELVANPLPGELGENPYSVTKEPGSTEAKAEGYVTAGGHVPYGVTDFTLGHTGSLPTEKPNEVVQHIRTDVAPGLATNPTAVPFCSSAAFGTELVPGSTLYTAPTCPSSTEIGTQEATAYLPAAGIDLALKGKVYNLEQPTGRAALYGVALKLPKEVSGGALAAGFKEAEEKGAKPGVGGFPSLAEQKFLEEQQYYAHTLIEGSVEWGKESKGTNEGDYHDYFEINVSPTLPLISSRLVFFGRKGGDFITNATNCPGHLTTRLTIEDLEKTTVPRAYTPPAPIALAECEKIPFEPSFGLFPSTTQQDQPAELTAEAAVVRHPGETEIDTSDLKTATFTLPEGMTLNPSAAAGLSACSPAQARIHSATAGVGCPAGSELGTFALEVPTLPAGSLTGHIYLGGPESGPITGPPFTVYLDAESARYGISVRLRGEVIPNEVTGQVTTVFPENPEQPFTKAILHFNRGALAPVANPLVCGTVSAATAFVPYSGTPTQTPASNPFTFDANGSGGACASPIPFAPTQTTANQSSAPGAHTAFTFSLTRNDGQQYLSGISTTLPEGLVGLIPSATQCSEAAANSETEECPSTSRLGTATVLAGAGPTPYTFSGPVYLTGPYKGAPFGLSIKVPAVAGPFNLGTVVARATININQYTARVTTADAEVPRIRRGVPMRLRKLTVAIEKQGFLINPTSCSALTTETTAAGFTTPGAAAMATFTLPPSPFQLANCSAQAFKPGFRAATSARTSRKNGASLETTVSETAGQSNIKSVLVQLPAQLPSRLTTLNKACPEAAFAANPYSCPSGSFVGGVRANTPTLKDKMKGPAILVSHGGEAFPDLDLILEADGVKVILVGNTDIKNGITRTHFAAPPDVPVSSITVNLPVGSHSALAAFGNFCKVPLVMPTTIEGQNGKIIKQNTKIKVNGCGVQVIGRKLIGHTLYLTVRTFAAGRVSVSGGGYGVVYNHFRGAVARAGIKVRVRGGKRKIRVGFLPKNRGLGSSATFLTIR